MDHRHRHSSNSLQDLPRNTPEWDDGYERLRTSVDPPIVPAGGYGRGWKLVAAAPVPSMRASRRSIRGKLTGKTGLRHVW